MRKFIKFGKSSDSSTRSLNGYSAYGSLAGVITDRKRLSWTLMFVGISTALFGLHLWQNHLNGQKASQIEATSISSKPLLESSGSTLSAQSSTSSPDVTSDGTNDSVTSSQSVVNSSTDSSVVIDGQDIDVPESGTVHKTVKSNDGSSTIDINIDNGNNNGNSHQYINSTTRSSKGYTNTSLNFRTSTNILSSN